MEQTFPNNNELRKAFMELLESQVGKGIYVWGGNGELLDTVANPEGWIRRREANAADAARAIALLRKRKATMVREIRAFDCSGLVYWALNALGLQKTDVSSRGLYALCGPVVEEELMSGDLVFRHDGSRIVHVGVCAGEEQIECRGRDVGVVKNRRAAGYWNRFGRLHILQKPSEKAYVVVKGNSVRIRRGDSTAAPCIGIAHKNDRLTLLGTAPSGWYRIAYKTGEAYITSGPRYTEVRYG